MRDARPKASSAFAAGTVVVLTGVSGSSKSSLAFSTLCRRPAREFHMKEKADD